jgi:enoyl-CoA hydratase/carnithine racemase
MSEIQVETRDGVSVITLNRPDRLNAFTLTMIDSWAAALRELHADPDCRCVVITGAGRAFCAGVDLDTLDEDEDAAEFKRVLWVRIYQVARAVHDTDKPVIAAMNGPAVGAGLDMALQCDLRIASETASFSMGYVRLGLVPGDGGPYLLPRLVGISRALELFWTGRAIDGREAREIGLVTEAVPDGQVLPRAMELAHEIAAAPAEVVRVTKRLVYECASLELGTALELISSQAAIVRTTEESRAAREAFLDARQARKRRGRPDGT